MPFRLPHILGFLSGILAITGVGTPAMSQTPSSRVPGAPTGVMAFVDVSVIPMDTDRVLNGQTVLVEYGRITAFGPSRDVRVPVGATQIDGQGKYLIPGLADMHAHLFPPEDSVVAENRLFLWLAYGLTMARVLDHGYDMHGERALPLRARAAAGELLSPRLYVAGYLGVGKYLGDPDPSGSNHKSIPLPLEQVAAAVIAYKAAGYDFIKVHNLYRHVEVFDSLAAMARRVGLPLVGHAVVPLNRALQEYRSLEHLFGYIPGDGGWGEPGELETDYSAPDLGARIQAMAEATQRAGVWNCPTLSNTMQDAELFKFFTGKPIGVPIRRALIKALQDAGAGLLLGSDRLQENPGATHNELEALVEAGLTPYQALATGTRNVAVYFGTLNETGTIAVGKRADLVLLGANPLADIRNSTQIAGVMLGGRWLAKEAIDRRVAAITASGAR